MTNVSDLSQASAKRSRRGIRVNPDLPDTRLPSAPVLLPFASILADSQIQQRVAVDADLIADYASGIREWIAQAPLTVFFDGATHWLADGFHRLGACEVEGLEQVSCIVHQGGRLDALRYALGANAKHGKQRTSSDLVKAYQRAIQEKFVEPGDSKAVAALLNCSARWAEMLTREDRNRIKLEREATIQRLAGEGKNQREISKLVGVNQATVSRVLVDAKTQTSQMHQDPKPPISDDDGWSPFLPDDAAPTPSIDPATSAAIAAEFGLQPSAPDHESPALQAAKQAYQALHGVDLPRFCDWIRIQRGGVW